MKKVYLLLFSITILAIISSCGDDEDVPPAPDPVAAFNQSTVFAEPGETVTFTNTSMNGETFAWDFGDGGTSNLESPGYNWTQAGSYTITLTAINADGKESTASSTILIAAKINVSFDRDRQIAEPGIEVTFTNTSTEGDTYLWEFGDGNTSDMENPVYTYTTAGDYTVTLTIKSSEGREGTQATPFVVGSRWVEGFDFILVNPQRADGSDWDEDGTGPDLFFAIVETDATSVSAFAIQDDLDQATLPLVGTLNADAQFPFTNEDWSFLLIDNDDPADDLNVNELMLGLEGNPLLTGEVDYDTGAGTIQLLNEDRTTEIIVRFQLRN